VEKYKDKRADTADRIEDILPRMTLDEKLAQLASDLPVKLMIADSFCHGVLKREYPNGLGRLTQYSMAGILCPDDIIRLSNAVQKYFIEETRLGIPVTFQSESLSGYPARGGTIFPSMLNLASTFDPSLIESMGRAISAECRSVGIRQVLSPVLDVARDPRWGRCYETYGEDTYLVTQMSVAHVRGLQKNKKDGVLATGKHFLGYGETEGGRNTAPTRIGNRELYEIFATPFEAAIKKADMAAIMASYSEIDGIPCGANKNIIRKLLREILGFDGLVVSDGGAVRRLYEVNHIARDYQEAGLLGILGGMETEMPIGASYRRLDSYIKSGELDMALIDEAVRHVLASKFEAGLFDDPYVEERNNSGFAPEHRQLSAEIAEKSIILLKNDGGLLPLPKGKRIALIGPHGGETSSSMPGYTIGGYFRMVRNWLCAQTGVSAQGSSFQGVADAINEVKIGTDAAAQGIDKSAVQRLFDGLSPDTEAVFRHEYGALPLCQALASWGSVGYAQGCRIMGEDRGGFDEAIKLAAESDLVIMTLGGNCGWEESTGGEGKDRSSLALPGVQQELLEAVARTGRDIVLLIYGPGIYAPELPAAVKAAAQVWLPGPAAGEAVAAVLTGRVNPAGKLPVSVLRSSGHILYFYNHKAGNGIRDPQAEKNPVHTIFQGGYTDADDTPLYPFGFGLSYTTFDISPPELESDSVPLGGKIAIRCRVTNTGDRPGAEVVQMYYHDAEARVTRPVIELAGFTKVFLEPGQSRNITFVVDTAQLGFYNENMEFVVEPGIAEFRIGNSSANLSDPVKVRLSGKPLNVMGKRSYSCEVKLENE
jgi:beta-glucosidase